MRLTQFFVHTLKETPSEAEVVSHSLMLRAGMIRRLAAGIYSYLPFGLRTLHKVEQIIRECMNEAGAIEVLMPSIHPAELWQESGRWDKYGNLMLKIKDRQNRDFCYGPTHEEVITDIARGVINSYKQLPVNFYQIQTKFRDEIRPRYGLMRGREFIMKDAYSFDIDDASANVSYEKMRQAYRNIFDRCGFEYKMVEADSGDIGGAHSHEFMVLANTGEDTIMSCTQCEYAANIEKAIALAPETVKYSDTRKFAEVRTPSAHTVEEVANLLSIPTSAVIKTMIIKGDGKFYAFVVRGDHELNMFKVKNFLKVLEAEMAQPTDILEQTGSPVGFSGPVGLNMPIYADSAIKDLGWTVAGANKEDHHMVGVVVGEHYKPAEFADFRNAIATDKCPECGANYEVIKGIEVGHIFKLGTVYSEPMQAKVLDSNGRQQSMHMGCYGIGVGRIIAASIEQRHDDAGIYWPVAIAPFEACVIPLNTNDNEVTAVAEKIYQELLKQGIDVAIDDRADRAGSKLADADLIGYPVRINVGKKFIVDGQVEFVIRDTRKTEVVKIDEAADRVVEFIRANKKL